MFGKKLNILSPVKPLQRVEVGISFFLKIIAYKEGRYMNNRRTVKSSIEYKAQKFGAQ